MRSYSNPLAERISTFAAELDDDPTVQGIFYCIAATLGQGDIQTLNLLGGITSRFSSAAMFNMGISREQAVEMAESFIPEGLRRRTEE